MLVLVASFFVIGLAFVVMLGSSSPQPNGPQVAPGAPLPTDRNPPDLSTVPSLKSGEGEPRDPRLELVQPPKDGWDKLSAISTLLSGIVVALIGFYATNVYDRRQKEAEGRRKDRELKILQVQTIEKFIPHLSSSDEKEKASALIAIAALGNDELAVKLASLFGGPGSTAALANLVATAAPPTVAAASRALSDLLEYLKQRVVSVHDSDNRRASGFVVSGRIVTTAHAVEDIPADHLWVRLPSGEKQIATKLVVDNQRDLALLSTKSDSPFATLDVSDWTPTLGAHVIALLPTADGELETRVGSVTMIAVSVSVHFSDGDKLLDHRIGVRLESFPGSSGAPVLDEQGRLVGIIEASDQHSNTFLIAVSQVESFIKSQAPPELTA